MKDSYSTRRTADALPTETRGRQGLCTFCEVAASCALIEQSGMPVLECEEFRAAAQRERRAIEERDTPETSAEVFLSGESDHADWGRKGLCGNCAIHGTCPFSKAEGGIWHCEEYR